MTRGQVAAFPPLSGRRRVSERRSAGSPQLDDGEPDGVRVTGPLASERAVTYLGTPAVTDIERLTRDEARWLAVIAQRLDRRPPSARQPATVKGRLLATIRALGCVQLDTISVVARSHETVLWSRLGAYDPALLAELHHPDGALFEYWAHAAAIAPIETFPIYRRAMAAYRTRNESPGSWAVEHAATLERVLAAVRERGPTASRHFARADGPRPDPWTWWGGKPDRRALDHLWSRGDLMVLRREGFQRVYDLTERILPDAHVDDPPPLAEQRRRFVARALAALGVATPRWTADYFRSGSRPHVPPAEARTELGAMERDGLARRVEIDGLPEPVWLDAALLPRLSELRAGRGRPTLTTLLSPFDNLIWHRERTETLFDFTYRLESYTPAPRRLYGYYTLPILHRGRLVGRIDPSYDRRARVLTAKAVHLEPGIRPTGPLVAAIATALRDLSRFLGGEAVRVLSTDPPEIAHPLRIALAAVP